MVKPGFGNEAEGRIRQAEKPTEENTDEERGGGKRGGGLTLTVC